MGSISSTRSRVLLAIAAIALAVNVGRQLYRWVAFSEERDDLRRVGAHLDEVALAVMRTQLLADSLRAAIRDLDGRLEARRGGLAGYERRADGGGLPPRVYEEYRGVLEEYNALVARRNGDFDRWRDAVTRNHRAVEGYHTLADSVRAIGTRMGEPYIAIPSPAEVAVRHGLDTTASFLRRRAPPTD